MQSSSRPVTITVPLPGGQTRLREMILFVAKECIESGRFGAVKLNKIIWKADFDSYAERGIPVTGRAYKRQKLGPVLHEMVPLQNDMTRSGEILIEQVDLGDSFVELRTIALRDPNLRLFTEDDLEYVRRSIRHYWTMTGTESSDESHGVAWKTRRNGDFMPYETALLSDRRPGKAQMDRLRRIVESRKLATR